MSRDAGDWAVFRMTDEQTREGSYKADDFVVEAGEKHIVSISKSL